MLSDLYVLAASMICEHLGTYNSLILFRSKVAVFQFPLSSVVERVTSTSRYDEVSRSSRLVGKLLSGLLASGLAFSFLSFILWFS
jgi:hypothetical protein